MPVSIPEDKKLTVVFRVEPGCLGPEGAQYIDAFCEYSTQQFKCIDADCVIWKIVPRKDKKLPEVEYFALNKRLNTGQANTYLSVLEKDLDELEGHLHSSLATQIDAFMRPAV